MDRLWGWVPAGTRFRGPKGVTQANKSYRVKVFRVYDVDHDHPETLPCGPACAPGSAAYVSWVDAGAHWCAAKLDFIDERDPRWYRG